MSKAKLPFVVECKSTQAFFEPIAAFNCRSPAVYYKEECQHANPNFEYRLKEPKSKGGWVNDRRTTALEGGITMIEFKSSTPGFAEISFYTPEVIKGAGPILRGCMSRQPVKGAKWVGHTSTRNRVVVTSNKFNAVAQMVTEIQRDIARLGSQYPADVFLLKRN